MDVREIKAQVKKKMQLLINFLNIIICSKLLMSFKINKWINLKKSKLKNADCS